MKKILLTIMTLLMLVSCGKQTYIINGSVEPETQLDGQTVYLILDGSSDTLSTVVKDYHFRFKGKTEGTTAAILNFDGQGEAFFFVEPGKIEVEIEEEKGYSGYEVSGTPNNDLLNQFNDDQEDLVERYQEGELSDEDMMEEYIGLVQNFIRTNANTAAGRYILLSNADMLTTKQLDDDFALLDEESMQDSHISQLYERFLLLQGTAEGEPYTDFKAPIPEGGELALSDIVGKTAYVLVDFWASWCGPCRRSMPQMKELYAKHQDKLEILGVSLDNDEGRWKEAISSLGLPWRHISDLKGWECAAAQAYGVNAIPATVLIDKEGTIIGRNLEASQIDALLSK